MSAWTFTATGTRSWPSAPGGRSRRDGPPSSSSTSAGGAFSRSQRIPPDDENPSRAPQGCDFELVAPAPNRFAVFHGSLTHGVLDAKNQVPERKLPGNPPLRLAVIFNWWHRPPERVPRWASRRVYRTLALSSSRRQLLSSPG